MNFAPYQWRAGEGYVPPPGSYPMPLCPQLYVAPAPLGYYPPPPPFNAYPSGPVVAIPPPRAAPSSSPPKPPAPPSKKEDDAKTTIQSLAPSAPVKLRPGVNYMHAPTHTFLHIFNKAAPVWEPKYKTESLAFKIFKVSTQFTVKEVIERVIKGKPGEGAKWAVTEVVEGGGGVWRKGTTIEYESDKAKGTLGAMCWDEKKGSEGVPPVWLVVHKL